MSTVRPSRSLIHNLTRRCYSHQTLPQTPPSPRHFLSINDLDLAELTNLIYRSSHHKTSHRANEGQPCCPTPLSNQTLALLFSKRSTRTRVSCESAIARLGGHPMFLGKEDIQLSVNESIRDTSTIISSMTAGIIARVAAHQHILDLAKSSTVPVINALSDDWHPLQTLADILTIWEVSGHGNRSRGDDAKGEGEGLGLEGLRIAWVGDANNVLFDLITASLKLGLHISVASPTGYGIPSAMKAKILAAKVGLERPGSLFETTVPEEALKNADIVVTDTWISMGWEDQRAARMKAFEGFMVTEDLVRSGGAKADWKFMHCMPRHAEEVDDEVFYGPRSLVFREGENRLWTTMAALEAFVCKKGRIERH